jgi:hypothetical protein
MSSENLKNKFILGLFLVVLLIIYLMFSIKYNSRKKIKELKKIEHMIVEEEEKIRLLKIDLEHISRPKAVRKMLFLTPDLQPIQSSQVIVIEERQ